MICFIISKLLLEDNLIGNNNNFLSLFFNNNKLMNIYIYIYELYVASVEWNALQMREKVLNLNKYLFFLFYRY